MNRVRVLDDLDGVVLSLAVGDELEGSILTEVLEALARRPAHVHGLDVLGREVVGGDSALASEFDVEGSEVAQADLVASEELFAQAADCVAEDALDGTLREGRVVLRDVFGKLIEVEHLMHLRRAIGLRLGDVRLQRTGLRAHNANRIVNHGSKIFKVNRFFEVKEEVNSLTLVEVNELCSWTIVLGPCGIVRRFSA